MEVDMISILVQGGAVGISVALIVLVYAMQKKQNGMLEQLIEVITQNAVALQALRQCIDASVESNKELKGLILGDLIKLSRRRGKVDPKSTQL